MKDEAKAEEVEGVQASTTAETNQKKEEKQTESQIITT